MSGPDDSGDPGAPGATGDARPTNLGDYDITASDQDTSGDMGVSSEREGHAGPGQHGTGGTRDVGPAERDADDDVPPEQSAGGVEVHPDPPVPPKSGYASHDPRSEDHPYDGRPRT
jgi:hypothetical protein